MPNHARLAGSGDKPRQPALDTIDEARTTTLAMLAAHQPADEKEARDLRCIQSLILAHPNIFSSDCKVGHITASAVIVEMQSRRTLLHFHKRLGRWLQVGGHLENETNIARAALREAREETGLPDLRFHPADGAPLPVDFDVHTIPRSDDQPEHLHLDFRYVLATSQPRALAPAAGESSRLRWLSFAEALEMGDEIDASLHRLLAKARDLFRLA